MFQGAFGVRGNLVQGLKPSSLEIDLALTGAEARRFDEQPATKLQRAGLDYRCEARTTSRAAQL